MKDNPGFNSLMYAVQHKDIKMVEFLIQAGANVNIAESDYGNTPLLDAVRDEHTEIVKLLLAAGADVNARTIDPPNDSLKEYYGSVTALMRAAQIASLELIDTLLDAGADINAQDAAGVTPLMWVILRHHPKVTMKNRYDAINLLIKRGADVNLRDINGLSALSLATEAGMKKIVQLLKTSGAT